MSNTRKPPVGKPATRAVVKPSDADFEYASSSGAVITVPSMSKMDPDMDAVQAYAEAMAGPMNEIMSAAINIKFLRSSLPEEPGKQLGKLKLTEFETFLDAWSTHSGMKLGESAAS